jgi:hypothetical protein
MQQAMFNCTGINTSSLTSGIAMHSYHIVLWNAFRSNSILSMSRKRTIIKACTIKPIITLYQIFKVLKVHFLQTPRCSVRAVSTHCEKETEVAVTSVLGVTHVLIYTANIHLQSYSPFNLNVNFTMFLNIVSSSCISNAI